MFQHLLAILPWMTLAPNVSCTHVCVPQVWLKQPLVRVDEINSRLDVVEALVDDPELRERLRDQHLRGGCDWGASTCAAEVRNSPAVHLVEE